MKGLALGWQWAGFGMARWRAEGALTMFGESGAILPTPTYAALAAFARYDLARWKDESGFHDGLASIGFSGSTLDSLLEG
jgi:hypothetical protein